MLCLGRIEQEQEKFSFLPSRPFDAGNQLETIMRYWIEFHSAMNHMDVQDWAQP